MKDPDITSLPPAALDALRVALLENAHDLYRDARMLLDAGRVARAGSLAIICLEELAKLLPVWIIRNAGTLPLGLTPSDVTKMFRTHTHKLAVSDIVNGLIAAMLSDGDPDEVLKKLVADVSADNGASVNTRAEHFNRRKQDGFYVSWASNPELHPLVPRAAMPEDLARMLVDSAESSVFMYEVMDFAVATRVLGSHEAAVAAIEARSHQGLRELIDDLAKRPARKARANGE